MSITKDKAKCLHKNCGWTGLFSDLLMATSPFDANEDLHGCPTCKSVDSAVMVCDVTDCKKEVSCGWPSADGYRSTCHEHGEYFRRPVDIEVVDFVPSRPMPLEDTDLNSPDWVDSVLGEP